jgi:hypothetical protein
MMNALNALQAERDSWQTDLGRLAGLRTPDLETAEELLVTIRRTVNTYRQRVLPRMAAERDLVLPALLDEGELDALSVFTTIVGDELARLVDVLDDLRQDVIQRGATADLRLRATAALAAIEVLSTVSLRFAHEVELPRLADRLTRHQSEQLADAVHAYEKSMAR